LRRLELCGHKFTAGGIEALGRADWALAELDLFDCGLDDLAAAALAASPLLGGVYRLNLGENPISSAGAAALARSPHVGGIVELDLNRNRIDDAGAQALVEADSLRSLRALQLKGNPIKDEGAVRCGLVDRTGGRVALNLNWW
jgi:hypothetical protein